ncbi:DUF4906 domain-containing protein [Bacteroides sp.]|uniref:DUF4906 domain-containing protein n=1 Tax=Bacteroides sp. TaxID=29523 RepID=UPI002FC5F087
MKQAYIFLLSCLLLTACTKNEEWISNVSKADTVAVQLSLQCAEISVDSRATIPQDPLTDNPMYSLCLLHYNSEGQLIAEDTKTQDLTDPQLNYLWNVSLRNSGNNIETLCLVANMQGSYPVWPSTLAELKEICVGLQFNSNTGLIADRKMYMFGYYEGKITANQNIRIMMGRMANSLRLAISAANSNDRYRINKIEINKPSRETYFFPRSSTDRNFSNNIVELFNSNNTIGRGGATELLFYYQTGENISPSQSNRTSVIITATKNNANPKTYTVVLGADEPNTTVNRNYSLYRNNNYTFNILLN